MKWLIICMALLILCSSSNMGKQIMGEMEMKWDIDNHDKESKIQKQEIGEGKLGGRRRTNHIGYSVLRRNRTYMTKIG